MYPSGIYTKETHTNNSFHTLFFVISDLKKTFKLVIKHCNEAILYPIVCMLQFYMAESNVVTMLNYLFIVGYILYPIINK